MDSDLLEALPSSFVSCILQLHGEDGERWLNDLPVLIEQAEARWSIRVLKPLPDQTYNFVALALGQDGSESVFKAGVPNRELTTEIEALRVYNGEGMVRLLESDAEMGLILMERLIPGKPLSTIEDEDEAVGIACQVMRRLRRSVPEDHPFPTVADWAKGLHRLRREFNGNAGPFPEDLVVLAEKLFDDLIPTPSGSVLLHGDLHHGNILSTDRSGWVALDPKGVVGEPEYEVGAFLRNPLPEIAEHPNLDRILSRRLDQFSEQLGFDRERILGWGLAQAVLSGWWSYEDHGQGWEPAIDIGQCLARLRNGMD